MAEKEKIFKLNIFEKLKNKYFFILIIITLNILITNIYWNYKSNNYNNYIENLKLKSEIKLLQQQIESLNLILKEKQKLINEQMSMRSSGVTEETMFGGIGGGRAIKFKNLEVDTIKTELSNSVRVQLSAAEKREIYEYTPTIWPVRGYVSSKFGYRISPFNNLQEFHEGIDITAPFGAQINAAASGVVLFAGPKPGYGFMLIIQHKYGYATAYAHCAKLFVKEGQHIKKGDVIAAVGNTGRSSGPHLHYEIRANGILIDPELYMVGY